MVPLNSHLASHFNSHAHVERDVTVQKSIHYLRNFNSHAHVERDDSERQYIVNMLHFNSHAHVERDGYQLIYHTHIYISTHTLTWSVTMNEFYASGLTNISTHTLTWSVTCVVQISVTVQKFQLTRSRGA